MKTKSYYTEQVSFIVTDGEYNATVQFRDTQNKTNWMNLNKDSAIDIASWLFREFDLRHNDIDING